MAEPFSRKREKDMTLPPWTNHRPNCSVVPRYNWNGTETSMAMFEREKMYGHRARIGYTSPPLTTEVFPYEFYKIVPAGVTLVVTSLAIVVRSKAEVDQSYEISMRAAREMTAAGCDLIMLGGVPINLSRGFKNAQSMIDELEAELGVKVTTSQRAQSSAAKALGARKMVMAHPYEEGDTDRIAGYPHYDCEIIASKAWGSPFNQIGRIPRDAALRLGRELMRAHPDADTIFMPSPHWPTLEAIEPLEKEFGVNVITALQVIVWHALRQVGISDKIEGCGRLFREF
jgi:maleate isomerase